MLGVLVVALCRPTAPVAAQVSVDPSSMEPLAWTRVAFRVVNVGETPWTHIRVEIPEAIGVLGAQAPQGWTASHRAATDTTPQEITWTGGVLAPGQYDEFAFLARLGADVPRRELRFPVALTDEAGETMRLRRGGDGAEPRIMIAGTTRVSPWAAFALAGGAFGLASLALVVAWRSHTPSALRTPTSGGGP